MLPAGLAAVAAAKADGRWDRAYAPPSELEVPEDLLAAVAADPANSPAASAAPPLRTARRVCTSLSVSLKPVSRRTKKDSSYSIGG